tara:strand:- start:1698 stop:1994 length:297 start_codon:yes stop_codon:yes gene_type:complete
MCLLYNNFFRDIINILYDSIYNIKNNECNDNDDDNDDDDDNIDKIIDYITTNKEILVNENNELILYENKEDNILIDKLTELNYNSEYYTESDDYVYIN